MTQNDINEHSPSELSPNALYKFWTESMKLPTIGPMFAFSKEFTDYANDIVNLGKVMSELKTQNDNYWAMMGAAFAKASKLTKLAKDSTERAFIRELCGLRAHRDEPSAVF